MSVPTRPQSGDADLAAMNRVILEVAVDRVYAASYLSHVVRAGGRRDGMK
ncbi:hypothetical protein [Nonomuraea sp. CA-141351]